jgi:hypothetical protein
MHYTGYVVVILTGNDCLFFYIWHPFLKSMLTLFHLLV